MRLRLAFLFLAVLGLALYLWGALAAPVVLWSDSRLDLDWARRGIGIFVAAPSVGHPAKPGYLLFLKAATALPVSEGPPRAAVLAQSILLWASIAGTAFYFGRRRGAPAGVALYALLILFLRLRDTSSAVMTEAIGAALFLPLAALLMDPPVKLRGFFLWGLGAAFLFWVRPNLGAAALCLATIRLAPEKRWRPLILVLAGFLSICLPGSLATRRAAGEDPLRGLSYPVLEATADYYWRPSIEPWPRAGSLAAQPRAELSKALENWKATLPRSGPDARRQILWRALHGLFGIEYYDARWSTTYRRLTTLSREASPFLLVAALALLVALPLRGSQRGIGLMALCLPLLLVGHDLVLGPNPRYILPFLPGLLLFGTAGALGLKERRLPRVLAPILFAGLLAFLAVERHLLDWQWGMVESSGVRLLQRIPRGALPSGEPATLHVRIAPSLLPSNAHLRIRGPGGRDLYSSTEDPSRSSPFVTLRLPAWLLEANRRNSIEIELSSEGDYGPAFFLLFPVIPPPWTPSCRREGSSEISPATGIARGALDWWAHEGAP